MQPSNTGKPFYLLIAAILFLTAISCGDQNKSSPSIQMNWQPIDSLNQRLPAAVKVFAGRNDALPLRAWVVQIKEPDPSVALRVLLAGDSTDLRESAGDFASRSGACVIVNGGYFNMNSIPANHVGLLAIDGRVIAPATPSVLRESQRFPIARAAVGIFEDDALDIAWVRSRHDTLFAWQESPLPNRPGEPALPPDFSRAATWRARDAIGAGPMLMSQGNVHIGANEEVFFGTSIPAVHPRTAIGYKKSGEIILMVVDGRQDTSRGVNLEELAGLMQDLGAYEALNLDGGGSSALIVTGVLLNRPAGGVFQREVMSAIGVFRN